MCSGNRSKTLLASVVLVGFVWNASDVAAAVLVTNIDEPTRAMNVLPTDGFAAQSFITNGVSYSLSSVDVLLGNLLGAPAIVAELRDGDASMPGATTLATFTIGAVPAGTPAPVTLTPIGAVTLDPLTSYWLVLGALGPTDADTFTWSYAEGNAFTGPGSLGAFNYSADLGVTWTNFGSENPFQIRVEANPVPLPAAIWMLGGALLALLGARSRRTRPA